MSFYLECIDRRDGPDIENIDEPVDLVSKELSEEEQFLLDCYRSGQIEESAWTQHMAEHPALERHWQNGRQMSLRTFVFSGLGAEQVAIVATDLADAVSAYEGKMRCGKLVQVPDQSDGDCLVAISLGSPNADGFEPTQHEGTFAVVSRRH